MIVRFFILLSPLYLASNIAGVGDLIQSRQPGEQQKERSMPMKELRQVMQQDLAAGHWYCGVHYGPWCRPISNQHVLPAEPAEVEHGTEIGLVNPAHNKEKLGS